MKILKTDFEVVPPSVGVTLQSMFRKLQLISLSNSDYDSPALCHRFPPPRLKSQQSKNEGENN